MTSRGIGNVVSAVLEREGNSTGVMRPEVVANVGSAAVGAPGAACCWSVEVAPPPVGAALANRLISDWRSRFVTG